MNSRRILTVATIIEASTGLALMAAPAWVARLLLDEVLSGAGLVVGRLSGIGLFSLALACWPSPTPTVSALRAMCIYNTLAAVYLVLLLVTGAFTGNLLIGITVLHAVLAALLARAWSRSHTEATARN